SALQVMCHATAAAAAKGTGTGAATAAAPSTSIGYRQSEKAAAAAHKVAQEGEATQGLAQIITHIAAYLQQHQPQEAAAAAAAASAAAAAPSAPPPPSAAAGADAAPAADRTASGAHASSSGSGSGAAIASGGGGSSSPGCSAAAYVAVLKPLQVDAVSGLDKAGAHHYANSVRNESHVPKTRAMRLAKEVASLESLLPLSPSSSVFVRVDEGAVQLWKAIVIGPEDTPYSGGCFVFDFYFPPQYPNSPPQVHLVTTGGGRVRFNPNLYAEGKVCLSLLGTWSGDRGEQWNADVSTAVQVLISIQSLIMVPEPYFNEPSYEGQTDERGKTASREYNKAVRENCVRYAMLDVLRHPPACLAEVVRGHFRLRREALLAQIKSWADEGRQHDSGHAGRLMDMRKELETLIAAL
ncbi:hypothetical protein Agub_g13904, partial [Astrephomene gubernaculifera]